MKKLLISISILLSAVALKASTVTLSSTATGPSVFLPDATSLVPNGSLVLVGTLTTANDFTTFVEFGTSTIKNAGVGGSARPSKLTGSVSNASEADDAVFNNSPVYVWIFSTNTLPATAAERQALPQGLFLSETFNFPVNDTAGVGDAVTPTATSFLTAVNLPFQTQQATVNMAGDNGTGNATGGRFVLGMAIPEPSTSLFAVAGAVLALVRRRR